MRDAEDRIAVGAGRPGGWARLLRLVLPLSLLLAGGGADAQVAPDGEWRTRITPHFRVTYPADLPGLGARAAERAEAAYEAMSDAFVEPPEGRIELIISDHTDVSNGFASVFPSNRITIFAPPPTDGLTLSYFDDWLELVIVHELAHIYHLDLTGPLGGVVRAVFGRVPVPWPVFPGLNTPGWTREGLATYYESALTDAGRTHGTYHDMVVRTALLEGSFEELDQMSGDSPVWPDGNRAYVYGSQFFDWLLERHGRDRMDDFARSVSDQWVPFRLNSAAENAFGVSFSEAWSAWRDDLEGRLDALRDSLTSRAPLTRTVAVTSEGRFALNPKPSPDGAWLAFARSDGRSDPQVRLLRPDGSSGRKLARTNGVSNLAWTPAGELIVAQLEYRDPYRIRSDLYRIDREGASRRITRGARLDQPDVAPGGGVAVAVQHGEGTNRLVEVDLESGDVTALTPFDSAVHWAYPRISPDGRRIAVARWERDRQFDIVLLDRDGRISTRVTSDRAVDLTPAWSPDGRWLVWASDRTGIWNVLAARIEAGSGRVGPTRQLTNVLTGVAYPSVGPEGRWLYLSAYHAHGWQVERTRFRPAEAFEPYGTDPRFARRGGEAGDGGVEVAEPGARAAALPADSARPYSAFPSLQPHYWIPSWEAGDDALVERDDGSGSRIEVVEPAVGLSTSGRDLVGRHAYSLRGTVTLGDARFRGRFGYRYAGLGNPVLGLSLSQDHDAVPRALSAEREDGGRETLFVVERERRLAASATLVRRRWRSVLSLGFEGSVIGEHQELLGPDLEPSRSFALARPDRTQWQGRVTLAGDNTRFHPFSISREDGVGGLVQLRLRKEVSLPDTLVGVPGGDRSFSDVIVRLRGYKSIGGPGFADHVLAVRFVGGVAGGAGADAFHYEVGGGSGRPEPLTGLELFGGGSSLFPVRGFSEGDRFGRYAWSASAEYRFPLALVHEGWGLVPFHLDRISGALFADAGNAWGPELGTESVRFQNPLRSAIASAGGELSARTLPFWAGPLTFRLGAALPLREGGGASVYLRVGASF